MYNLLVFLDDRLSLFEIISWLPCIIIRVIIVLPLNKNVLCKLRE